MNTSKDNDSVAEIDTRPRPVDVTPIRVSVERAIVPVTVADIDNRIATKLARELGHGKRMLTPGGKLDKTFTITVAESLDAGR